MESGLVSALVEEDFVCYIFIIEKKFYHVHMLFKLVLYLQKQ